MSSEFEQSLKPSIRVTFQDWMDPTQYWHRDLQCLPPVGAALIIDTAPKGTRHEIVGVEHHIGSEHRIVAYVKAQLPLPAVPAPF